MREHENLDGALVIVLVPLLSAVSLLALPGRMVVDTSHENDIHVGSSGDVRKHEDRGADEKHVSLEASETDVTVVEELQRVSVIDSLADLIVKIVGLNSVELDLSFRKFSECLETLNDLLHALDLLQGLRTEHFLSLCLLFFGVFVLENRIDDWFRHFFLNFLEVVIIFTNQFFSFLSLAFNFFVFDIVVSTFVDTFLIFIVFMNHIGRHVFFNGDLVLLLFKLNRLEVANFPGLGTFLIDTRQLESVTPLKLFEAL